MAARSFAIALTIYLTHPAAIEAQAPARPAFEVATVKVSQRPWLQIAPQRSGGRISWTTDLHYLIQYAYRIAPWQLSGPVPGSDSIYEVQAETAAGASDDQVRVMFQSLLADRFHMQAHRVSKEVEGWALTVGKSSPKMKAAKEGEQPPLPEWFAKAGANPADLEGKVVATIPAAGVGALTGRRVSMKQFAESLQRVMGTMVIDDTGLAGTYYFATEYALENHPPEVDLPPLAVALQEDLGLKLERRKVQAEMLVVDRIDRTPSEN